MSGIEDYLPALEQEAPALELTPYINVLGQPTAPLTTHSVPPVQFTNPFSGEENPFTFDNPSTPFNDVPVSPTDTSGFATSMAEVLDSEVENALQSWGADALAIPPATFPPHAQYNIQPLPHVTPPHVAFDPLPESYFDGFYEQMPLPVSLPEFNLDLLNVEHMPEPLPLQGFNYDLHNAHVTGAISPFFTQAFDAPSPPENVFGYLDTPSPLSSSSYSSPDSSTSVPTSRSPESLLGKRPRDGSVGDSPPSATFRCKWDRCNKDIIYTPKSDEGGFPDVIRHHIQHHYPVVQKQTEVPCLWESCNKYTTQDNLRKHILKHLPEFHYHCPGSGCGTSCQRSERWDAHATKCEKYHTYLKACGKPLPTKRVKTATKRIKN